MKKFFALITVAVMLCASLSGCTFNNTDYPEDQIHTVTDEANVNETEKEVIRYTYRVAYKDIEFVSEESKEEWREDLFKLISNEGTMHYDGDTFADYYDYPRPDEPGIRKGWYLGLFDINVDGIPELLVDLGGGSAGNAFYEVFDILTGERLGYMNGGHEDSWCIYLDTNMGDFEAVGQFEWRRGWMGKTRFIKKADITYTSIDNEEYLYETDYLTATYSIDSIALDLTQEDIEKGIHGYWDEVYTDVYFNVNGDKSYIENYFGELDHFMQTYIRIPETALKLIYRNDYTDAEDMVDALLSSSQQYISPKS